jgi:hypothetical protein
MHDERVNFLPRGKRKTPRFLGGPGRFVSSRLYAACLFHIKADQHVLAGFEVRNAFGLDVDRYAATGIATDPGVTCAGREGSEPTQFNASILGQAPGDLIEKGIDDQFAVLPRNVGIFLNQKLNQLGTDHGTRLSINDTELMAHSRGTEECYSPIPSEKKALN